MELHVLDSGKVTVVLLDNSMKIVKPVYDFLTFQQQKSKADNTLLANGRDLCLFWIFLEKNGYAYDQVTPRMIAEFIDFLRGGGDMQALYKESNRSNRTINRILSTVHTFYQYQADMQEIDTPMLMHEVNRPLNMFKDILEHARTDNKTKQSIFKLKESSYAVHLVTDAEMDNRLRKAFELGIRHGAAADRESIKRSAQTDQVTRLLIVLMRRQHIDLEQAMATFELSKDDRKMYRLIIEGRQKQSRG